MVTSRRSVTEHIYIVHILIVNLSTVESPVNLWYQPQANLLQLHMSALLVVQGKIHTKYVEMHLFASTLST